ncbi:MAG: DNA helicase UvrD, partial [Nitrospirae bacterium]
KAAEAAARAAEAACAALEDGRGRWLLGPHEEAAWERPLAAPLGGRIVHATPDLTFVEAGVRWVVDYKTATHEGGDREAFLAAEWERYRPQLARYAALLARLDPRPIRIALYHPLLGGWREAAWEGEAAGGVTPPAAGGS